jgi:hypothetical protein
MRHKNKFTGILDKNGVKINNADTVLVYHHNSYPKHPYNCTVVYKHGWKLKSNDDSKQGTDYDVYSWRKSIEVVSSNNESVFITKNFNELKEDWFHRNVSIMASREEIQLLYKCFEEAFLLGQEEIITKDYE